MRSGWEEPTETRITRSVRSVGAACLYGIRDQIDENLHDLVTVQQEPWQLGDVALERYSVAGESGVIDVVRIFDKIPDKDGSRSTVPLAYDCWELTSCLM